MFESKNIITNEDNKNIIIQKDINNTKYLSTKEEFNWKLDQQVNNTNKFNKNIKNIILKLKKENLNYKIIFILLICIIVILLIILSINKTINIILIIDEKGNKAKNDNNIIPNEKISISNSSIFEIVYNDIIFNNYISGEFFSNLSNNKTIFYVKKDYLNEQAWRVTKNYIVLISHN